MSDVSKGISRVQTGVVIGAVKGHEPMGHNRLPSRGRVGGHVPRSSPLAVGDQARALPAYYLVPVEPMIDLRACYSPASAKSRQVPWTPFNGCVPRSSKTVLDPTTRSRTVP